jgi:hypothetical protein
MSAPGEGDVGAAMSSVDSEQHPTAAPSASPSTPPPASTSSGIATVRDADVLPTRGAAAPSQRAAPDGGLAKPTSSAAASSDPPGIAATIIAAAARGLSARRVLEARRLLRQKHESAALLQAERNPEPSLHPPTPVDSRARFDSLTHVFPAGPRQEYVRSYLLLRTYRARLNERLIRDKGGGALPSCLGAALGL